MLLKANFHMHTREDPVDKISYTIYKAIDHAAKSGFDVLTFTPHRKFVCKQEYVDYASQKNVLLIPGIEANIEKKHVVILNCDESINFIKTFKDLKVYKKKNPQIFVFAPHPFVLSSKSLGKKLLENIDLFDAIELSVFSNKIFNFNEKAVSVAEKYNKPLIATSDTHFLKDLGRGYVLIETQKKTAEAVFEAIKNKNFENKMDSMGILAMLEFQIKAKTRYLLSIPLPPT